MSAMHRTSTQRTVRPEWQNRLLRATIWHPDAIPVFEGETSAELKRFVLPAFDGIIIIMGIMAVATGMPTFDVIYNSWVSAISGSTLLVAAAVAAIGLIFPRFWFLEAVGKIFMLIVLAGYAIALWILVIRGEGARGFVAGAMTALAVIILWNLRRIGRERQARKIQAGSVK